MQDRNTRRQLWENVSALMQAHYGGENLTRLAKEAKFGPGSATRLKEQNTSVGIDILDKLAKVFRIEPWQLLAPRLVVSSHPAQAGLSTRASDSPQSAGRQNSLTEHMVALEIAVDGLAPELRTVGRDALRKWANKDASASEVAGTLEALAKATLAMAAQKKPNGTSGPIGRAA